ncbi:MAG: prenyltransferase [Kibdelosporangium sp.]
MTAAWIAAVQETSGAIPWYPGGPADPWNHVEAAMGLDIGGYHAEAEAAYRWLAETQNDDGSWYAEYQNGIVTNAAKDTNFTAYIAVGVLHHAVLRGSSFLVRLWPTVRAAVDFVLRMRSQEGAIQWRDTSPQFLLTGCASIHQSLLCAATIASEVAEPRPDWLDAASDLASVIRERPELFTPKPHAMDWYYPVLYSVVTGQAADRRLAESWDRFVEPDLGVRCVADQPWVTGGETAELALTLALRGDSRARDLLAGIETLRHSDGSYWTGYQFANKVIWPPERTTWTAGAVLLARAAVAGDPGVHRVFRSRDFPVVPREAERYPIE